LKYESLERLRTFGPVDRLDHIAEICRGRTVLDIGCLDETALAKRDTQHWLHGRISQVAARVVGVDSSNLIPRDGLITGPRSVIFKGDGLNIDSNILESTRFDLIVAGEFIEHLDSPLTFLTRLKQVLPGRELVLSTPNGACFANTLMGSIGREVQHRDHLANFSFKILNTLCLRAGLTNWEIRPYRFYATEMILQSHGLKKLTASCVQNGVRVVERLFPLLSFGYIVRATL
jgi:SAM-dependent methyltransferase